MTPSARKLAALRSAASCFPPKLIRRKLSLPCPDRAEHKTNRGCHQYAVDRLCNDRLSHVVDGLAVIALDRAERLARLAFSLRCRVAGQTADRILHPAHDGLRSAFYLILHHGDSRSS